MLLRASVNVRELDLQDFLVLQGLNDGLVMILVNIAVDGRGDLFVLRGLHVLVDNSLADVLIDGSLVLSVLGEEARDGLLGFFHCNWFFFFPLKLQMLSFLLLVSFSVEEFQTDI